jgi:hypothetical protein
MSRFFVHLAIWSLLAAAYFAKVPVKTALRSHVPLLRRMLGTFVFCSSVCH